MHLLLHHCPGACSRVVLECLEQTGAAYEERGVALMRGEQREAAFRAINPKGKVPVLVVDGVAITETPAILAFLARVFPDAGLLPFGRGPGGDMVGASDLIWCAGTLHPIVHRIFRPEAYADADAPAVKTAAIGQLRGHAARIETRLAGDPWWYGPGWSAVDPYLAWIFAMAEMSGFALAGFSRIQAHRDRSSQRPSHLRALDTERRATERDLPQLSAFPRTRHRETNDA